MRLFRLPSAVGNGSIRSCRSGSTCSARSAASNSRPERDQDNALFSTIKERVMDSPLTPADVLPYLREAARLTGLPLDDDQATRVATQFVQSARMAATLMDFSLPPSLDPFALPLLPVVSTQDEHD